MKEKLLKSKPYIILVILLGVLLCSFLWVGEKYANDVKDKYNKIILQDEYTGYTSSIVDEKGIEQKFNIDEQQKIHGVIVNIHTFNKVVNGTVFVDLLSSNSEILASASEDMIKILDNTFMPFKFNNVVDAKKNEEFTLHIYTKPNTPEDKIAIWKSEKTIDDFDLLENGYEVEGSIALHIMTNSIQKNFIPWFYFIMCLSLVVIGLLYYFAIIKNLKFEYCFLIAGVFIAFVFAIFTPIKGIADEPVHYASAYRYSNTLLGIENADSKIKVTMRKEDVKQIEDNLQFNALNFSDLASGIIKKDNSNNEYQELEINYIENLVHFYIPQTLGITIARIFSLDFVATVVIARIFNAICYMIIAFFAIKFMPVFKNTLAVIALLPMPMQLAGSLSYDVMLIAGSFLFVAYVLKILYSNNKINKKDIAILLFTIIILSTAKLIYIILVPFVFLIDKNKFSKEKLVKKFKTIVVLVVVISWVMVNISSIITNVAIKYPTFAFKVVMHVVQDYEPKNVKKYMPWWDYESDNITTEQIEANYVDENGIKANGDSIYTFSPGYIFKNIPQTVKLTINSFVENGEMYLNSLIGTKLFEGILVDITVTSLLLFAVLLLLYLSLHINNDMAITYKLKYKVYSVAILSLVFLAVLGASITWTPINYEKIFGFQGRYLLPVLIFAMIMCYNKKIKLNKIKNNSLILIITCINVFVILNAFAIMCGF